MAHNWFIVHAYSNFEKQLANSIKEQAIQRGMEDKFSEILVPTEDVVQVRKGRKVQSERKFFPGYVLVKMEMSDEAYHLVKKTNKVVKKDYKSINSYKPTGNFIYDTNMLEKIDFINIENYQVSRIQKHYS